MKAERRGIDLGWRASLSLAEREKVALKKMRLLHRASTANAEDERVKVNAYVISFEELTGSF